MEIPNNIAERVHIVFSPLFHLNKTYVSAYKPTNPAMADAISPYTRS